jgi:hypothetical protein
MQSTGPIRASDPGVRLWQVAEVKWVHCPRCDGPARSHAGRLVCKSCAYAEGGPAPNRRRLREVVLEKQHPKCPARQCGAPVPAVGRVVRGGGSEQLMAVVRCPTCGQTSQHPALALTPAEIGRGNRRFWNRFYRRGPSLYLTRDIGAHVLTVYNRTHLELLAAWLGAGLRERGPEAGLTMMARLPRWMKAAGNRERIIKALDDIRAQMDRERLND